VDVNIPGLAWRDVLAAIRKMENDMELGPLARVKVVMVSSLSGPDSVAEARDAGCDDYIVKPINPQIFLERIDRLFP
jgi:PleD family two-component response regulator